MIGKINRLAIIEKDGKLRLLLVFLLAMVSLGVEGKGPSINSPHDEDIEEVMKGGFLFKNTPSYFPEDIALMMRAEKAGDSSICLKFEGQIGALFEYCVENVVRETKNERSCDVYREFKKKYQGAYDSCRDLVLYINDPALYCDKHYPKTELQQCISSASHKINKIRPNTTTLTRRQWEKQFQNK